MTDEFKSGLALIAGSLGGIVTMAVHPVGGSALTAPQLDSLMTLSAFAHTLAMLSYGTVLLGTLGLTLHLARKNSGETPDRSPIAALIIYGFASVALLLATAVSGFIVPALVHHMVRDSAGSSSQWHIVIHAVFQFNQTFAQIYSIAACGAVLLWSIAALRSGGLGRGVAIYGCVFAPVLTGLIAVGHIQLDVHGMAIIVVADAIWFILAGAQLMQRGQRVILPA